MLVNTIIINKKRMHRQMEMENFLRLPPPPPVIPGIVVDDDVTNDERRVDDVFIATLDSRVSLLLLLFVVRKRLTKKHTKLL